MDSVGVSVVQYSAVQPSGTTLIVSSLPASSRSTEEPLKDVIPVVP